MPLETTSLPVVSVIVPTYNSASTIAETLESIQAQNCSTEILAIDDGSTDETVEVIRRVCPQAHVYQQSNGGPASARNRGLREARGTFVAFLDADDIWFPGKLEAQIASLKKNPSVGFCYTSWLVSDRAPTPAEIEELAAREQWPSADAIDEKLSGWLYAELLADVVIHTSTLMMHTSLARSVGFFDEALRRGQDFEYWLRLAQSAPGLKLRRPFSLYRQHADNITRKPQPRNYAYEIRSNAIRRWGIPSRPDFGRTQVRALLAQSCRDFAWLHLQHGSAAISFRSSMLAIRENPLNARNVWASLKIGTRATLRALSGRNPNAPGTRNS
jgi:glycosyltransferase involved in cell wall biosynthesis